MALTGTHRLLLASAAVVVTAGAAVTIGGGGGGGGGGPDTPSRATPAVQAVAPEGLAGPRGHDLAASLSGTTAIPASPTTIDGDTLERVAAHQDVETERAWPLAIPGDDRTAWLFAGPGRLVLVVPRTVVDPERGRQPDDTSIFGVRVSDLVDRPLIATQAGGGRAPRTLVLVPEGVEPPRIVARAGDEAIREMPHRGRLYAARLLPGEELVIGTRRLGTPDAP